MKHIGLKILIDIYGSKFYFILGICILILSNSCIDKYIPPIENQNSHSITVFGQITNNEGYQTVSISNSSAMILHITPQFEPISGCTVIINDNLGNSFNLSEYQPGIYRIWMTKDLLKPGTSYKLKVTTPSGEEIESDFDQLPESPKIDSIYYLRKDLLTSNPSKPLQGIQFYIDMDASNTNSRYFMWELEETYEHHAVYPKKTYWDGKAIRQVNPPDYSMMVCWSTEKIKNHFTMSTENFAQNKLMMHPLNFVSNLTQRLTYGYSLLVKQYALSPSAYTFWELLRENNELGGLYGKQPNSIKGNLRNLTFPEKRILGFFQATAIETKRIFVSDVPNLEKYYLGCEPDSGPFTLPKNSPIIYLWEGGKLENACVECFAEGGTTQKPDFWPY